MQLMYERRPIRRIVQKRTRDLRRLARGASVKRFEMVHGNQCPCFCDPCSEMTDVFNEALEAAKAINAIEEADPREEQAKWDKMIKPVELRA